MTHYSKTLYARNKAGETKTWSIKVEGTKNKAEIIIETTSKEGAKPVIRGESITEGKNIGRSNETTPLEQAISEAQARYEEKILKKGYVTKKSQIGSYLANNFGLPIPMLAKEYEPDREYPKEVYLQRKYNGHRMVYSSKLNLLYSRGGKEIDTLDHIKQAIEDHEDIWNQINEENILLDGEAYTHMLSLQDQTAAIKKTNSNTKHVRFAIYDIIWPANMTLPNSQRIAVLNQFERYISAGSAIFRAPTEKISLDVLDKKVDKFIEEGYEGGIIRLPDGVYEPGQRSSGLLKVKRFKDAEWLVKNILPGANVTINGKDYTPARLICAVNGGQGEFEVMAPGNYEEKQEILKHKKKYIGQMVTIKYYDMTNDGIPFHPVALQFRDDI